MSLQYVGLKEINGPLVVLDNVEGAAYDEVVDIRLDDGSSRIGRVVEVSGKRAVLQVFEGTKGLSLKNTRSRFMGKPMEMQLSPEILGRVFNGAGRPVDGLGEIFPEKSADINGKPLNPVSREYPRNYINTGISTGTALGDTIARASMMISTVCVLWGWIYKIERELPRDGLSVAEILNCPS